jgi:hypothetical protein
MAALEHVARRGPSVNVTILPCVRTDRHEWFTYGWCRSRLGGFEPVDSPGGQTREGYDLAEADGGTRVTVFNVLGPRRGKLIAPLALRSARNATAPPTSRRPSRLRWRRTEGQWSAPVSPTQCSRTRLMETWGRRRPQHMNVPEWSLWASVRDVRRPGVRARYSTSSASSAIESTPPRAFDTGQPSLAASASCWNSSASMPGTRACERKRMCVMAKPSPALSS